MSYARGRPPWPDRAEGLGCAHAWPGLHVARGLRFALFALPVCARCVMCTRAHTQCTQQPRLTAVQRRTQHGYSATCCWCDQERRQEQVLGKSDLLHTHQGRKSPAATCLAVRPELSKVPTVLGCCLMVLRLSRLCAHLRRRPTELWEVGRGLWQPDGYRVASSAAPAPVESQANQGFVDGGYSVTDFPPDKVPPTFSSLKLKCALASSAAAARRRL